MSKFAEIRVTLKPDLDEYVRTAANEGHFPSASEYVEDLLQQKYDTHRRQKLDEALDRGLADIEAGRSLPLDEAFAEITSRIRISKP